MRTEQSRRAPQVVEFEDHSLLPFLFGEHDRNLARIEQKLDVSIASRGNLLKITGDADTVPVALATLDGLYNRLKDEKDRGVGPSALEFGVVDAAVKWAQRSAAPGRGTMAGFADSGLAIATWKRPIHPRSPAQAAYVESLKRDELVFGVGPAGTGKTYLAVAMAVQMLKERRVDRLILSRPAVEAGERLGFLPGELKEKMDPYLRPLYDALHDMMPSEQVERRLASGEIEVAPLAFMRGRTLANAFIILDEAQNTTPTQMKMFLTRIGENSRMAITGDLSQIDLPLGAKSGLRDALEVLAEVPGLGITRFTDEDVVRHHLVTRIVRAYAHREGQLPFGERGVPGR